MKKVWQAQTDRQTDSNFFKGKSIWKCYLQNVGHFFRPKYRLIWCLFFIKVYQQPKLKREILLISKFHNKILYQSKNYLMHSQLHRNACRIPNESQGHVCSTIFIISYQTLAQCMCQSSTPIRNMYNLHNILYKISYNSISKPCVEQKKIYSRKYFRNISWHIYMSIIYQNKIFPYFAWCACCVPHVPVSSTRYSMSISSYMFHKDSIVHLQSVPN